MILRLLGGTQTVRLITLGQVALIQGVSIALGLLAHQNGDSGSLHLGVQVRFCMVHGL
jgi:hypothetical protein